MNRLRNNLVHGLALVLALLLAAAVVAGLRAAAVCPRAPAAPAER